MQPVKSQLVLLEDNLDLQSPPNQCLRFETPTKQSADQIFSLSPQYSSEPAEYLIPKLLPPLESSSHQSSRNIGIYSSAFENARAQESSKDHRTSYIVERPLVDDKLWWRRPFFSPPSSTYISSPGSMLHASEQSGELLDDSLPNKQHINKSPPTPPVPSWLNSPTRMWNDSADTPYIPHGKSSPSEQPINFLHLLAPSSSPPYAVFVQRIIAYSDQQASIFLQQKLKASSDIPQERVKIVDAICNDGFEMMVSKFRT